MYKVGLLYHILLSCSLYYIGEIFTLLLFQIPFFLMFIRKKEVQFFLYIPILFLILVKLFASSYVLYFLVLVASLYLTLYFKLLYSVVEIFLYTLYLGFLYSCCSYFEYSIYELYIELDFKDSIYFISNEVVTILTIGHLFILLILGYNRESIYTSKYN
jgi:hypothetical protein